MRDTDDTYARLRWRCRRGMRELDAADKSRFAAILDLPDPELYGYLAGRSEPPDESIAALIERIRTSLHSRA